VRLTGLAVRGFRNLAALELELPAEGVVIVGGNGQGKTNLLEAIYYLMLFRSLRGAKDRELVQFGEPGFWLRGTAGEDTSAQLQVGVGYELSTARKAVFLDGSEVKKLGDAVGQIVAVPFGPADSEIVSGAPSIRRRFMDVVLSVSRPGYMSRLGELRHALRQRNAALRRGRADEARAFDGPVAEAAAFVAGSRRAWVEEWKARFRELCAAMGEFAIADLRYVSQVEDSGSVEAWRERLEHSAERDLRGGTTTVGPHRDDLRIGLGGRDIRLYGSAGQRRTAAIALRVLEAETLTRARGTAPIGLYDDVFAELDQDRQARLLELLRASLPGQAIVVAPRDAEVPAELFDRPRWQIREGRIVR
jgi:DNA replication and repair protein RecF